MKNIDIMEIIRTGLNVKFAEHFTRDYYNEGIQEFRFIKQPPDTTILQCYNKEQDQWATVEDTGDIGFFVDCPNPIIKAPFKPEDRESFWFIGVKGEKIAGFYDKSNQLYLLLYKMGNCYASCDDADVDCEKWVLYYQRIKDLLK